MRNWHKEPATNKQIRALRFFCLYKGSQKFTKGQAGFIISLVEPDKKNLWEKYKYFTNDIDNNSDQLRPFEFETLKQIELPESWYSIKKVNIEEVAISDTLEAAENLEGILFDNPLPDIIYQGRHFTFTGECFFGRRKDCEKAVIERGAVVSSLTFETDYLVIGGKGSDSWKKGTFGNKIIKAFGLKNKYGKIAIIKESDWVKSLNNDR